MRSVNAADLERSAMDGDIREARAGRSAEDAPETAARRRLTLRHLHDLIEALREEHRKLEIRVDRLSELVDRMTVKDADLRRNAGFADGRIGGPRFAAPRESAPDAGAADGVLGDAAGFRKDAAFGRGTAERIAADDRAAFGFAIWAGVERAIGNAAAMLAAGREADAMPAAGQVADAIPAVGRGADAIQAAGRNIDADVPANPVYRAQPALFRHRRPPERDRHEVPIESLLFELREAARIADEIAANASGADHRASPAHPVRAPDNAGGAASDAKAADGAACGFDAAGLDAADRDAARHDASGERTAAGEGPAGTAAAAPDPEASGRNASDAMGPAEPPATTARATDAAGEAVITGDAVFGAKTPDSVAAAHGTDHAGVAPGGAAARAAGSPHPEPSAAADPAGMAEKAAVSRPGAESSSAGNNRQAEPRLADAGNSRPASSQLVTDLGHRPAASQPSDDRSGSAHAADISPHSPLLQPETSMPAILIPRSERHRTRKKRSLWTRLFHRKHADC